MYSDFLAMLHKAYHVDFHQQEKAVCRLETISRLDLAAQIPGLKQRVHICRATPDDRPLIYVTGFGCSMYAAQLEDELKIM